MGIVERIVSPVLATAGSPSVYRSKTTRYDYAIDGVPFSSATTAQVVYEDTTAPWRKQQVDQSEEPGEQSLDGWWQRSQATFHAGAGQAALDGADLTGEFRTQRFLRSRGVDVWTPGRASMLRDTERQQVISQAVPAFAVGAPANVPTYWVSDDTTLRWGTEATTGATAWGGTNTILSLASDGTRIFVADSVGVWNPSIKIYDTGSSRVVLRWAKQRLMAAIGTSVYELDPNNPTPPALPAPKFTHPNPDWTWTDIVEGPGAIYASGFAGNNGAIFKFVLDASGAVPTLTTGLKSAELPLGEVPTALLAYLGTFLVLGTSKGVRVARFDGTDVQWGPLSVSTPSAVYALAAEDRFIYAGWTDPAYPDACGLVRLDLSMEVATGMFAYANDLRANNYVGSGGDFGEHPQTGTVYGVGVVNGRLALAVGGVGVYMEAGTRLAPTAALVTSRIRYRVAEPKMFRTVRYRCAGPAGSVSVAVGRNTDTASALTFTLDVGADAVSGDVEVGGDPCEFVVLEFGFTRRAGAPVAEEGPRLEEYLLKALPAHRRQRLISVPLRVQDSDRDGSGQAFGRPGWAVERKEALEALESAGRPVLFQVLAGPPAERRSWLVTIDELRYVQQVAPKETTAWGGVIIATLRTVT